MVPSCLIIHGLGLGEEPSSDCNLEDLEVGSAILYCVLLSVGLNT